MTAPGKYTLGYLRRGVYGTPISAHAAGSGILRLGDDAILKLPYTKDRIGQTLHVKLVSYNAYGGGHQDIADIAPATYTLVGPPRPPTPTGVSAQQSGNVINFAWTATSDYAVDIAVGPQGCAAGVTVDQAWAAMSMVAEAARGSYDANASIQPGNWTIGFRLRNIWSDQLSAGMATVDLAVSNALPGSRPLPITGITRASDGIERTFSGREGRFWVIMMHRPPSRGTVNSSSNSLPASSRWVAMKSTSSLCPTALEIAACLIPETS